MVVITINEIIGLAILGVAAGAWLLLLIICAIDALIRKIRGKK